MVGKVIIDKAQAVYVFSKLSHCILNLKNRKHHMLFDLFEIVLQYIYIYFSSFVYLPSSNAWIHSRYVQYLLSSQILL